MDGARTMWAFSQKGSVVCNFFVPREKVTDGVKEELELSLMNLLEAEEDYELEEIDHSDSDDVHMAPFIELKYTVYTSPRSVNELHKRLTTQFVSDQNIKQAAHAQKVESDMNFLVYHPNSSIAISDEEATLSLLKITELLEDDDDVVAVYHNARYVDA
jgi:transcriptional/translational regulatory protein YebC/TACO1